MWRPSRRRRRRLVFLFCFFLSLLHSLSLYHSFFFHPSSYYYYSFVIEIFLFPFLLFLTVLVIVVLFVSSFESFLFLLFFIIDWISYSFHSNCDVVGGVFLLSVCRFCYCCCTCYSFMWEGSCVSKYIVSIRRRILRRFSNSLSSLIFSLLFFFI